MNSILDQLVADFLGSIPENATEREIGHAEGYFVRVAGDLCADGEISAEDMGWALHALDLMASAECDYLRRKLAEEPLRGEPMRAALPMFDLSKRAAA